MEQVLIETPYNVLRSQQSHINYNNHSRNIICCNCGGVGHGYARCNHPITSYGIICYKLVYDSKYNSVYPEYLMVQRKDSLSYVEFMRGKYDLQNITYISKLFTNMIEEERNQIVNNDFETLWTSLWSTTSGKNFMKEYVNSKEKFNKLKNGYLIKSKDTRDDEVLIVNIDLIISTTRSNLHETEWGFPKGRRSFSDEDDKRCALREFREETGIHLKSVRLSKDKPFEEVFSGTNKIRYKHVYYIAKYSQLPYSENYELFNPNNKCQAREIKDVRWFKYNDCQNKISETNIERKELFKRVNNMILRQVKMNAG